MIKGIGIDATEIDRFSSWHTHSTEQLKKIFSEEEIAYCLSIPAKSAERFAVRFATKEAVFKALSSAGNNAFPLFTVCKSTRVISTDDRPELFIDWSALGILAMKAHLSLTHTQNVAMAFVILEG